jgi:predicted dehydrogenase
MKFFIVGLGSMGKRRIRNLFVNGERDIVGFDIRADRNTEAKEKYDIKVVEKLTDMSPNDFDVLIISVSPEAHGDYIRFAIKHRKHFFIEHPTSTDGYDDILKAEGSGLVMAPSCTMRFYQPIKMIKKFVDEGRIGKIWAFQYHMGQYLADWHPWEDYRTVYFSKKATGACREMFPFELTWLNWIMNSKIVSVAGTVAKLSDLDMDADDISLVNATYENGIQANIIIDVIARRPLRTLRLLGSNGVLDWERFDSEIKIYDAGTKETEVVPVPKGHPETGYVNEEEMYNDEIKTFLDAVNGKAPYPYTFEENYQKLQTLLALEKSSVTGERQKVAER